MMTTSKTILRTVPIGGGEPIESLPADILLYGFRINQSGPLEITLDLDHEKATRANIEAGVHEVEIIRNKAHVWNGPLTHMNETDSEETRVLVFNGEDGFSHAKKMFVTSTLTFDDVDQFQIVKQLLDHHQDKAGGDFGIDVSSIGTSGVTRDRTYYGHELKNIYDAITDLADVNNGFEVVWNAADRRLDAFYPRKGQRNTNLVWDQRTIRSFHRRHDATEQASQVLGVGAGEGSTSLRRSIQDSSAVAKYGLTQHVYSNMDVKNTSTLDDHIQRELSKFGDAPETIAITVGADRPAVFTYGLGDEGRVIWPSPWDPVNEYRRLLGFDIRWTQGDERAILYLDTL